MDIPTGHQNVAPEELFQLQPYLSSHCQPANQGSKCSPTSVFNEMKSWAISKCKSKQSSMPMTWQHEPLGCHKPQIPELNPPCQFGYQQVYVKEAIQPQPTELEYQTPHHMREPSQIPLKQDLGYQIHQIQEPPQDPDIFGYDEPLTHEISPIWQTDLKHQISDTPTKHQTHPRDSLSFDELIGSTSVNELIPNQSHQVKHNNETLLQPLVITSLCQMVEDPYFGPEFQESNDDGTSTEDIQQWNDNPCFQMNTILEANNIIPEAPKPDTMTGQNTRMQT